MKQAPAYIAPPPYGPLEAAAMQALQRGDATPHQQQAALRWIIEQAAGAYNLSYAPESDRATAFAEGRRFVGLQAIKLLKLDVEKLKKATTNE
jgi:hypothetical protein